MHINYGFQVLMFLITLFFKNQDKAIFLFLRAKISTTSSKSILLDVSLSIDSMAISLTRVSLMVDLKYVLVLLSVEKVRSHFAVLTGSVRATCS